MILVGASSCASSVWSSDDHSCSWTVLGGGTASSGGVTWGGSPGSASSLSSFDSSGGFVEKSRLPRR